MSVVAAPKQKSLAVAYGLWLALGLVGAHRFYLGKPKTALLFVACTLGGLAFSFSATPEWSKLISLSVVLAVYDLTRIPTLVARGTWAETPVGEDMGVPLWRQHTADIVYVAAIGVIAILGINLGLAGYSWLWVLALGTAWFLTYFLRFYLVQTNFWRNTFPAMPIHRKVALLGFGSGILSLVAAMPFAVGRLFAAF